MNRQEAIQIIKNNWPNGRHMLSEALEFLIPELKESEDEIIRKTIISGLKHDIASGQYKTIYCVNLEDVLVWFEKQKPDEWTDEDNKMVDLLISILEINHPDTYFKSTDKGDANMRAVPTKKITNWLKSLRQRMKGE